MGLTSIGASLLGPWRAYAEAAVVASLLAFGGAQTWRLHSSQAGEAKAKQEKAEQLTAWQKQVADGAKAALAASEAARAEETRRAAAQQGVIDDAKKQTARAQADAAAARDSHQRLLDRAQAAGRAACSGQGAGNSSPAGGGATALGAGLVPADLLRRSDERSGLLAGYADQARIAGHACERAFDSLTLKATP